MRTAIAFHFPGISNMPSDDNPRQIAFPRLFAVLVLCWITKTGHDHTKQAPLPARKAEVMS